MAHKSDTASSETANFGALPNCGPTWRRNFLRLVPFPMGCRRIATQSRNA